MDIMVSIPDDFRFSEEVITLKDNFVEQTDKPYNYDITFNSDKECNTNKDNPPISETKICRNCYYRRFTDKLASIRRSKRKDFILHQMSIRNDELTFLNELMDFLKDNENSLNRDDYNLTNEYEIAIDEILEAKGENDFDVNTFEEDNYLNLNDLQKFEMDLDIFISHSSVDKDVANALIDLFITALRIDPDNIRCTSVEGYKLKGGVNTDERLRKEIYSSKVLIGIISSESLKSHYVLFELGARWGSNLPFQPMVTDQSVYNVLRKPLDNLNLLNLSIHEDLQQMLEEISTDLNLNLASPTKYQKKIISLIEIIQERGIISNDDLDNSNNDIIEVELSEYTLKVLFELYNDPHGTLLVDENKDGYSINTNKKSFGDENNPRERAKWEVAFNQLLDLNFITPRGSAGTVFSMTQEGYDYVDSIK